MKKIFSYALMFVAAVAGLTSCDKDMDSNPTLETPTEFVLNNPSVGSALVDLNLSKGFDLSWSQPKFTNKNTPVVADYYFQLSTKGTFLSEYVDGVEGEYDYITLDDAVQTCTATVECASVAKALQQLNKYEDAPVPTTELWVRVAARVKNAGMTTLSEVASNAVQMTVLPYYVELKDAPVVMWYLVGNMFGGKWGSVVGETALPMFMKDGFGYDKKTGTGELEFTNWFGTGEYDGNENGDYGFKIQRDDFNWDWGMTGNNCKKGEIIYRNGGDDGGHILAAEDGVYTITMNTEKLTATMVKYEGTVKNYGTIQMAGSFNDWSDTAMLPYNKEGVENHAWYYVMENADAIEFKFKVAGSWDDNWGSSTFPTGIGTNNGPNISLPAGKWCISFNDITGAYSIIAL